MADLSLFLLGAPAAHLAETPITNFEYDKVRALLVYLAMENDRPQRREFLAGLLWPEYTESAARQSLSQALFVLRRAIGDRDAKPPFLLITAQTLQFNPDCSSYVDVTHFTTVWKAAQNHAHTDLFTCNLCRGQVQQAIQLYRGDFVAGFSLPDCPEFEAWITVQRERLRQQVLEMLQQLAAGYLQCGDMKPALTYARRQLELDPWCEPAHRQMMAALALSGQRADALVQYETCVQTLRAELDVAPEPATTALYEQLKATDEVSEDALRLALGMGTAMPAPGESPFKGLDFFDVADADLFFGREALTAKLVNRVRDGTRFLAVVGASGSGKSSLVRAGVAATLQRETNWTVQILTPGADPGRIDLPGLTQGYRLLVIDQFEELFTLCRKPDARQAFVTRLLATARDEAGSTRIVIALRADFYLHCSQFDALRLVLEQNQAYIGAMTTDELRRAIETPALNAGWRFEPGLVDMILHDVGADDLHLPEPGALPLLSHALLETWKRRRGRTLTLGGYTEAGGVHGAIANTADAVYKKLTPTQQNLARHLFIRLTEFGEGTQDTRRRITRSEILSDAQTAPAVETALDILANARLLTLEEDSVQVSHEALIREWPALRNWLEEDREGLQVYRHLTESALEWERLGRDPGDLYRSARLAQAIEWAAVHPDALNPLEHTYLSASQAEAQCREQEREAQRQRELAAAQQLAAAEHRRAAERGRMLRWIGVAALLLLLATITAVTLGSQYRAASQQNAELAGENAAIAAENASVAATAQTGQATAQAAEALAVTARERESEQREIAETAEREAAAQRDAAQAQAHINLALSLAGQAAIHEEKASELALLLALEANTLLDSPQTRGALLSALEHSPGRVQFLTGNGGVINGLAVSSDGALLASASGHEIRLWNAITGVPNGDPITGIGDEVRDVVFTGDGRYMAALARRYDAAAAPYVLFWDLAQDGGIGQPLGVLTSTHFSAGIESYMALSPDGHALVLAGCKERFTTPSGYVVCAGGGGATLWDISDFLAGSGDAVEVTFLDVAGEVWRVAFSPDGDAVALVGCAAYEETTCEQGFTTLWQPATGDVTGPAQGAFSNAQMTLVNAVTFTPDGGYLATAGCSAYEASGVCTQGKGNLWDLNTYESVAQFTIDGENGFQSLSASPDGRTLALGSSDTIRLWDLGSQDLSGLPMIGHTGHVLALAFTPDGETLFSGGQDLRIGVWDLALRGGIGSRLVTRPIPSFHVAYNPEGTIIATGGLGGIDLWDTATGEFAHTLPLSDPGSIVWDVAFSPDGKWLASAGLTDGAIRLWDLDTLSPIGQPVTPAPGESAYSVAFSPDGMSLASSGGAAEIVLWDVDSLIASAPLSRTLIGHEHGGNPQVVFSPDGTLLASAGHDNTARLWDVATGKPVGDALRAHEDNVLTVAFSPDGKRLASAGQDSTIRLWDVATQTLIAELAGHNQFVWRMAFTPDGTTLVSFDAWGIVRLWDMRDTASPGRPIGATLPGHKEWAWGLALSPDGKTAVTTARSGEIQKWHIDLAWWRERACALAGHNLTQAEWTQNLPGEPYRQTCPQWSEGE